MKKPNWRDAQYSQYSQYPASRIHSAMKAWANEQQKPRLKVTCHFKDGTYSITYYDRATKEVCYRHDGEVYTVEVDTAKYLNVDCEPSSKAEILKEERIFAEYHNLPVLQFVLDDDL